MRSHSRCWALLALVSLGCGGMRASRAPLGGEHEEPEPVRAALPAVPATAEAPALTPEEEREAEEVEIETPVVAASAKPASAPVEVAATGAFQLRSYVAGQSWTRVVDLELDVKMGPGGALAMRMVSHQEARFEVLAATSGGLSKVAIEYPVDRSSVSVMGNEQKDPDNLQGKRYLVTYAQGKVEVRSAGGGTPPKKELDSVQDDAREPLEMAIAFKELAQLTAQGSRGDFSHRGALALAGGEDEDTKIGSPRASLRQVSAAGAAPRSALVDVGYQLTNVIDDELSIVAQLSGNLTVLDAPARYRTVSLAGPLELRPADESGVGGSGSIKVSIVYTD